MYDHDKVKDNDSLQMLLLKMSHTYFRKSFEGLGNMGIHPGQLPMIKLLGEESGLSQREISDKLHVKPPTVAVSLKRMELAGLIERKADEKDQRISRIFLNVKGRALSQRLTEIIEKNEAVAFGDFTESEKCLIRRFFMQIIRNLEEMNEC